MEDLPTDCLWNVFTFLEHKQLFTSLRISTSVHFTTHKTLSLLNGLNEQIFSPLRDEHMRRLHSSCRNKIVFLSVMKHCAGLKTLPVQRSMWWRFPGWKHLVTCFPKLRKIVFVDDFQLDICPLRFLSSISVEEIVFTRQRWSIFRRKCLTHIKTFFFSFLGEYFRNIQVLVKNCTKVTGNIKEPKLHPSHTIKWIRSTVNKKYWLNGTETGCPSPRAHTYCRFHLKMNAKSEKTKIC